MSSQSSPPTLEKLYDCAQTLSNAKGLVQTRNAADFQIILSGVKGDTQTKRLSSQFITRFFIKFPNLANESLNAILDLCEDDDVNIRKQAIKDLPMLCRESKEFLPKIADVLSQLLQTQDSSELAVIQNSLMSLFRKEAKGTLIGLFSQIKTGGDVVRDRAITFLMVKIKTEGRELLNKEAEIQLLEEVKLCMGEECTANEFHKFMSILRMTSLPKTQTGQAKIVEMISKMVNFDKALDVYDEEAVDRIIQCSQAAAPLFCPQVRSTKYVEYICLRVLPLWDGIATTEQAHILKVLAELCTFTSQINCPLEAARNVYKILLEYLPCPPDGGDVEETNGEGPASKLIAEAASKFEFTKVECLLYTFHTVCKQAPQFLTDNPDVLKEFKTRLQYFALGIQGYIRKLREFLAGKSAAELNTTENKLKSTALKSVTNINSLIKDLFHSPPSYKTKIIVSWRPQLEEKSGIKRKSITFDVNTARKQSPVGQPSAKKKYVKTPIKVVGNKGVYQPPQGKYSSGLGMEARLKFGGGRGGTPRGARGRGRVY